MEQNPDTPILYLMVCLPAECFTADGKNAVGNVTANVSFPLVSGLSGQRIYIENIFPVVDFGRFPVKRIAGEPVDVWVDVFRDGHAVLAADVIWRGENSGKW